MTRPSRTSPGAATLPESLGTGAGALCGLRGCRGRARPPPAARGAGRGRAWPLVEGGRGLGLGGGALSGPAVVLVRTGVGSRRRSLRLWSPPGAWLLAGSKSVGGGCGRLREESAPGAGAVAGRGFEPAGRPDPKSSGVLWGQGWRFESRGGGPARSQALVSRLLGCGQCPARALQTPGPAGCLTTR